MENYNTAERHQYLMTKQPKPGSKVRTVIRWTLWVLLVQFVLLNISAALYAYKFTHLYSHEQRIADSKKNYSQNIFAKTWRLFKGPRFYRSPGIETPTFPYSTIILKTRDSLAIEAWYGKTDSAAKGTVILFHGLSGNKSTLLQQAYEFRYWNYNVMIVDIRAHGKSEGSATTIGFKESEDVKLAYDYIKQQGEKNIYLWGGSMGATTIIKAVAEYDLQPKGLMLEMPFGSLHSHIKARIKSMGFPKQPFAFLTTFWAGVENGFNGFGFNTVEYAKKIKCPVLLQYGLLDALVTQEETNDIYNAIASQDKKLVVYEETGHRLFLKTDKLRWRQEVEDFLMRTTQ